MKFQFNPNQTYQLDAISSVVDLFKGQIASYETFGSVGGKIGSIESLSSSKAGYSAGYYGNKLTLSDGQIEENLKAIQNKNHIRSVGNMSDKGKNFTVEMETGTGKTYVYLRTIFELNKQYDFTKFIIVVPSVAVRELDDEVLKALCEKENKADKIPDLISKKEDIVGSDDNLKPSAGKIYNAVKTTLNLTQSGSNHKAFMKDILVPLITKEMDIYKELENILSSFLNNDS